MDIFETVDGILEQIGIPFYHDMPESARESPDSFLVYSAYNTPSLYGDGDEIFGKDRNNVKNAYETLKPLLKNSGFIRTGTAYTADDDFPKYYRTSADFYIDLCNS